MLGQIDKVYLNYKNLMNVVITGNLKTKGQTFD